MVSDTREQPRALIPLEMPVVLDMKRLFAGVKAPSESFQPLITAFFKFGFVDYLKVLHFELD